MNANVSFAFKTSRENYIVSQVYDVSHMKNMKGRYDDRIGELLYRISNEGRNPADFIRSIKAIDADFFGTEDIFIGCAGDLSGIDDCTVYLFGTDIPMHKKYIELLPNIDALYANISYQLREAQKNIGELKASFFLDDGSIVLISADSSIKRKCKREYTIEKIGDNSPKNLIVTKNLREGLAQITACISRLNGSFYYGI